MKKQLKKAVAIVSALAMVVAGITVVPNSVKADTTGVEAPAEQLKVEMQQQLGLMMKQRQQELKKL